MYSSTAAVHVDRERGFLPLQDPLRRLCNRYDEWEEFALALPKHLASDGVRRRIRELPPFPDEQTLDERGLERAMVLLSFLGHAYVWTGAEPAPVLPSRIAVPWHRIARTLGRPPVLSYSSYALHNYFRIDPSREIECGNIALIQNFFGGIDEEWFILIHVDIERKAAPAIASLLDCLDAAANEDAATLQALLATVCEALRQMRRTLSRMPEWCDPYIYYHRVRPYIHGWKDHPDLPRGVIYDGVAEFGQHPQTFRGETGAQSAIVPCLDAMLGIGHKEDLLRTYLLEMRTYMPVAHRNFLTSLEQRGSVRDFVEKARWNELTGIYNACVQELEGFRTLHLEYAASYIFRQAQTDPKNPHAVGTGGTPFMRYLKKHRDETSLHTLR